LPLFAQRFPLLWLTASQSPVSDSLGIPTISSVARPVNTKAFTAIYPRKCYATTNFLDPDLDFWGLRQKVRLRRYQDLMSPTTRLSLAESAVHKLRYSVYTVDKTRGRRLLFLCVQASCGFTWAILAFLNLEAVGSPEKY
jgi:hypothetical protein